MVGRADSWKPWKGGEMEPELVADIGLPDAAAMAAAMRPQL